MKPIPQTITAEFVRESLDYCPETGEFTRKSAKPSQMRHVGKPAGAVHRTGYRVIKLCGKPHMAQRLAWLHFYGECPGEFFVDHINRDKLDNRICNLRKATNAQNRANSKVQTASGYKGVYPAPRMKNKWQAQINVDGKTTNLGIYDNAEDAATAYRDAATKSYGEFARFT